MRRIAFIILLLTSTSFAFGQQLLWSSVEKDSLKALNQYVPFSDVSKEVFEIYDMYDQYYDLTGYTKDSALDVFKIMTPKEKEKFKHITGPTALAVRANFGSGSCVIVYIINKTNINMIVFSNLSFISSMSPEYTTDKARFMKWFNSLLN